MIIERNEYNNGYGCSCFRSDWDDVEWIEESDAQSLKEIIDYVYDKKWYDRYMSEGYCDLGCFMRTDEYKTFDKNA